MIVSKGLCSTWRRKRVSLSTINEICTCCGIRTVGITTEAGDSTEVDVLVVPEKALVFDLLLRYDAIKLFGGLHITCM